MSQLTDDEKVRVRHHLGYLNIQEAQTFILGIPAGVQTSFIIEGAMNKVLDAALPLVRRLLATLDTIEGQMVDDAELAAVNGIGDIEINQKEQAQLRDQYDYHRRGLGNCFGVVPNPFDTRFEGGAGINVPVVH